MIKFNETYTIGNGDKVTFTEGKKGTINGTYSDATLTGTLEGNLLKATFHNKKVNATGLMEITFHENGFDAKWKQGLEPGPMRGKWNGLLQGASSKPTSAAEMSNLTAEQKEWIEKKDYWDYEEAPKEWLQSKEFILEAVKIHGSLLKYASENLREDRDVVLAAVTNNGNSLEYASENLREDREVVLAAITDSGHSLEYASENLREDRDVVLAAVTNNGNSLEYASESLREDRDVVLAAVTVSGSSLEYASENLREDRDVVLAAVTNNGNSLRYASENLREDREVVLAAITDSGYSLEYASENLREDRDVVLVAVSKDSNMLKHASKELKQDKEILAVAIQHNPKLSYLINDQLSEDQKQYLEEGVSIEDFDAEYHGDDDEKVEWMKEKAFLMEAVKHDERILKHASIELKADRELVMEAIKNGINAIDYADEDLQGDPEILTFRIVTFFKGNENIIITDEDLTIFLTNTSDPYNLIEELLFKFEFILLKNKKEEVKVFHKKLIKFINANHECYWILAPVVKRTRSIYDKFENCSYLGENAKSKFEEIAELKKLITFDIDFQPAIEFETYFIDSEISHNWDAGKWGTQEDDEGLSFSEFIMSETNMEWDTDSWDDAKFYNHAISRFWIALQNYSLSNRDQENMAVCLYSVVQEQYEPIQDSGCADYGINTFRTVIEFIWGMKRNDYDLNETDRDDLEEFNDWQFDLNKVASELYMDCFDDWPGPSEFAKRKK